MGTWMATVRFPDGAERYARYSTVVGALVSDLYATFHVEHHRAQVTGEPLPTFPDRPCAEIDELIPVVISDALDDYRWHAVYCPQRHMVLGPNSPFRFGQVQESHELIRGAGDGLRHLSRVDDRGLCGALVRDAPLPYHRDVWCQETEFPEVDIFADWSTPDICRECLLRAAG